MSSAVCVKGFNTFKKASGHTRMHIRDAPKSVVLTGATLAAVCVELALQCGEHEMTQVRSTGIATTFR